MKFINILILAGALATAMPSAAPIESDNLAARDIPADFEEIADISARSAFPEDLDESTMDVADGEHSGELAKRNPCYWSKCGRGCQNKRFFGMTNAGCGFFMKKYWCCPHGFGSAKN